MSTSLTFPSLNCHCGEHLRMVKTAKMEVLRVLLNECLSAAAEEIFKIVQRIIIEYEDDMCSKWALGSSHRLQDADKPQSEDSLQKTTDENLQSGPEQATASVTLNVSWEPENTSSEQTEDSLNMRDTQLESSPSSDSDQSDKEILPDMEHVELKQEYDSNKPLKIHRVKKTFKCPVCFSIFSSKRTLVQHIKLHSEDKSASYKCQFCHCHFNQKSEFIIHTRIHNRSKPYMYQDCDESLDQKDNLLLSRKEHAEGRPYQGFSDTDIHLKSMTPARKIEPDTRKDESDDGMKYFPLRITPYDRSEFDQESLQPLCLYQIQTVADIDKDASAVVPVDHIKTEPAGPDDGVSDNGRDHQLLLSVNQAEPGRCETETNHLSVNNILPAPHPGKSTNPAVMHEAGTVEKPFKCPCCSKCFSLTKTLIRHVRIHTEDKPYQCQYCGRNFCQKSDLVNHIRIHTGERPYKCQECHKSFAQKGNLVVHMRKHTGEKPYQCQQCSCSFGQRSSLEFHVKSHM